MSIHIQINDGTPHSGRDICQNCTHFHEAKGEELKQHVRYCRAIEAHIPFAVATCNGFRFHDEDDLRGKVGNCLWLDFDSKRGLMVGTGPYHRKVTLKAFLSRPAKSPRKHTNGARRGNDSGSRII